MIKYFFKRLFFVIGLVLTLPLAVLAWLEAFLFGRDTEHLYGCCKELLSLFPTHIGQYLRLGFYWAVCRNISLDADFQFGSMVAHRDTVIGPGSVIGCYSIIGRAAIGRNVLISSRVSIISGKYQHGRPQERTEADSSSSEYRRIDIGDDTWIGEGAVVMASLGAGCTVGAGSVVMKDFPDHSTVIGNPARKINLEQTNQ